MKSKNRVLETQSAELLDLESAKSDCEIFIAKLKADNEALDAEQITKEAELEAVRRGSELNESLLTEQRRLHQNLSNAHNTTLQKFKDLAEGRKQLSILHTAQIQDKDVMIRKLEIGLAQKMETVNSLLKDKKVMEAMLLKSRQEKAEQSSNSKQYLNVVSVVESPQDTPTIARRVPRKIHSRTPSRRDSPKPLSKVTIKSEMPTPDFVPSPDLSQEDSPIKSPPRETPRSRIKSSPRVIKRSNSLSDAAGARIKIARKRAKSAVQLRGTSAREKRRRKPARRYSPDSETPLGNHILNFHCH